MSTQPSYSRRSYHSGSSQNRRVRQPRNLTKKHVGIELEVVGVLDHRDVLSKLKLPRLAKDRPLVEEDGSLPAAGVEIIFPPFTVGSLKNKKSFFAQALQSLEGAVVDKHSDAGMHLNVELLDSMQANAIFLAVLHNLPPTIHHAVFLRSPGRYRYTLALTYLRDYADTRNLSNDHYYGAIFRGSSISNPKRIEVRFPASTVNHDEVKTMLEFLELLREYANAQAAILPSSSGAVTVASLFLGWLQTPEVSKRAMVKRVNAVLFPPPRPRAVRQVEAQVTTPEAAAAATWWYADEVVAF